MIDLSRLRAMVESGHVVHKDTVLNLISIVEDQSRNIDLDIIYSRRIALDQEKLTALLRAARSYRTYLPMGDIRGASGYSQMNHLAKKMHEAIESCAHIKFDSEG